MPHKDWELPDRAGDGSPTGAGAGGEGGGWGKVGGIEWGGRLRGDGRARGRGGGRGILFLSGLGDGGLKVTCIHPSCTSRPRQQGTAALAASL
jgi:hypothetical protein